MRIRIMQFSSEIPLILVINRPFCSVTFDSGAILWTIRLKRTIPFTPISSSSKSNYRLIGSENLGMGKTIKLNTTKDIDKVFCQIKTLETDYRFALIDEGNSKEHCRSIIMEIGKVWNSVKLYNITLEKEYTQCYRKVKVIVDKLQDDWIKRYKE